MASPERFEVLSTLRTEIQAEKLLRKKIEIENVVMKMKSKMKSKLNQNIGMSVSIAVVNTVQKFKKIKFLNRKITIRNEIMENQIENYIKVE